MSYAAPLREMRFVMDEVADGAGVAKLPGYEEATPDLIDAVLAQSDRFASQVMAPLNVVGDAQGARLENGVVRTAEGFADAYKAFVAGGWNSLPFDPAYGGQGLPWLVATAVQEMWQSANMSLALCPLLNYGVIAAMQAHASEEQKAAYLAPLIAGRWTGAMNLTEPQAGTDLGALRARAEPAPDLGPGRYRLHGQKIFITWGEHDMAENIVHLVLARVPGAPPGPHGVSLFIAPKFTLGADGALGPRNDVRAVSLERKLGIHASPTCVMSFGENDGAQAWIVGEENKGLRCMFTMMNNARNTVGLQGAAIAERAYQRAAAYAKERVQGRAIGAGAAPVAIIRHPDVRRMLMRMRAGAEATRALCYFNAAQFDRAQRAAAASDRSAAQARVDLLTPIVKAWCSDIGVEAASLGVQVHGGMGFIEETGAAQHLRDARIAPIYEGANGVQANDLVGRKLGRDGGAAATALIDDIAALDLAAFPDLQAAVSEAASALRRTTSWMVERLPDSPVDAIAGSVPYLRMFGLAVGGWLLAKGARAARRRLAEADADADAEFLEAKIATARFYAAHLLPEAVAQERPATAGAETLFDIADGRF